jgi:Zn-dependent membrane protease YugP
MHAPTDNAAPPRSVLNRRLLLTSWVYRHRRVSAGVRFAVAIWLVFLGGLLLADGYLWATLLLMAAAVLFWVGYLNLTAARSAPPRP